MSERCVDYDTCLGSNLFFVGYNPRFRYARHGYYPAYCGYCPDFRPDADRSIELRLLDLEATQYEPGGIPKWYLDRTQQLEGRVLHAEAKLQEHITAAKKRAQLKTPKQTLKGYKGIK